MSSASDTGKAALVAGASGAIGGAFYSLLSESDEFTSVLGTARKPAADKTIIPMDVTRPQNIEQAFGQIDQHLASGGLTLHTVIIACGILHGPDIRPERKLAELSPDAFNEVMAVNALGPLMVAKAALQRLPRKTPSRLAVVSARVGSLSDNRLGGWYSYRCSKAALNMGFKTLSVETHRTHPRCVISLLQPGTVDSALSAPFQAGQKSENIKNARDAARQMLTVLEQRSDPHAHLFVDWAGQDIPY